MKPPTHFTTLSAWWLTAVFSLCGCTQTSPGPTPPVEKEEAPLEVAAEQALEKLEHTDTAATKTQPSVPQTTPQEPRIGAIDGNVWIMPRPNKKGLALGKVRLGTSVALRKSEPVSTKECAKGWRAVEPRGYVCLNWQTTLDLNDPYFRALAEFAPAREAIWPYRYGYSRGAPMYSRIPTPEQWKRAERGMRKPGQHQQLDEWAKGHEELLEEDHDFVASDEIPWFFKGGKRHVGAPNRDLKRLVWRVIPNGSMLAFARAVEQHGRVWLLTPDLMVVPADRIQMMRQSRFEGVNLKKRGVKLPLAWNRSLEARSLYKRDETGRIMPIDNPLRGKGWVEVELKTVRDQGVRYLPVRTQQGVFVRRKDVTLTRPRKKLPRAIKRGAKWVDARIVPGTLTAYEGLEPVYTTLFSPGKGGAAIKGYDPTVHATTETGLFFFEWKERVATMTNEQGEPKVLWFSDVPFIQYLRAPLAMHVAYWHEDFGNKKSAECLNVSPRDGRWLFGFTGPEMPKDWGAVRPGGGNGKATPIMVNAY